MSKSMFTLVGSLKQIAKTCKNKTDVRRIGYESGDLGFSDCVLPPPNLGHILKDFTNTARAGMYARNRRLLARCYGFFGMSLPPFQQASPSRNCSNLQ